MSVKWPVMAAAAAICGLTRCVRPPRPWRPSKLRLLVDAHRSPGARMSGFMPRHMLQPGSRQSKPASVKTLSRPSFSVRAMVVPGSQPVKAQAEKEGLDKVFVEARFGKDLVETFFFGLRFYVL